jgi:hypothetical protein
MDQVVVSVTEPERPDSVKVNVNPAPVGENPGPVGNNIDIMAPDSIEDAMGRLALIPPTIEPFGFVKVTL